MCNKFYGNYIKRLSTWYEIFVFHIYNKFRVLLLGLSQTSFIDVRKKYLHASSGFHNRDRTCLNDLFYEKISPADRPQHTDWRHCWWHHWWLSMTALEGHHTPETAACGKITCMIIRPLRNASAKLEINMKVQYSVFQKTKQNPPMSSLLSSRRNFNMFLLTDR